MDKTTESAPGKTDAARDTCTVAVAAPRFVLNLNSVQVGTLIGLSGDGSALVDFAGNPFLSALHARSCVELHARDVGKDVVLWFEEGDFARPLLMGCVHRAVSNLLAPSSDADASGGIASVTCDADGDVRLSAQHSLTLRCGKASVTLTREGKVFINGTYVETRASNTNRVQGGSVRIN